MAKQNDLEIMFSKIHNNINYDNLTNTEILHLKTKYGITKFMQRIRIGRYSNFLLIFRNYEKLFNINEFQNILIELGLSKDEADAKILCGSLDGEKISYTLTSPDYLFFDIVNEGKTMRIRQNNWD